MLDPSILKDARLIVEDLKRLPDRDEIRTYRVAKALLDMQPAPAALRPPADHAAARAAQQQADMIERSMREAREGATAFLARMRERGLWFPEKTRMEDDDGSRADEPAVEREPDVLMGGDGEVKF